jgi:hypothetical protein
MSCLSRLFPAALALVLAGSLPRAEEQQPQRMPTRDVDITYDVTRPQRPQIYERVRWLASQHLERVDSPGKWTSIFDRDGNEITLLNGASHTFRKLEGGPRQQIEPEQGTLLKRDGEFVIAGLRCIDWSWTEDIETRTACITNDGVLLRLVVDGKTMIEARSVSYHQQLPELFEVPSNYAPALAPEGSSD